MEPCPTPEAPAVATPPSPVDARTLTPRPVWHWFILLTSAVEMLGVRLVAEQQRNADFSFLILNLSSRSQS
jgi:hypothetical protein